MEFFPYLCAMNVRRDKQKAVHRVLNPAQEVAATKSERTQHPVLKKLGDFFIDVAKLIVGGIILSGLMKQDIDFRVLIISGMFSVLGFLTMGILLVFYSNRNK